MSDKTIFEKIIDGEISADIVLEGEGFLAFRDINAQAPVHVLVVPRQKIENIHSITSMDDENILLFMKGIRETAEHLGLKEKGYRVVFNTGKDGGQTVNYLHAHILAGRRMNWPPG